MIQTAVSHSEPTTVEKLRGLPWSIAGNSANAVFVHLTYFGSLFILFVSELGMSKSQIGLLLSFFSFFGLMAPFIAARVARFGYKRTFITFYTIRKFITMLLLLTPAVLAAGGAWAAGVYVTAVTAIFAFCRAIAEIGVYPWLQEYVPNSVRGKYSANNNLFSTITSFTAVTIAGYVIEQYTGLERFTVLIGTGIAAGLLAAWMFNHIPGGAPIITSAEQDPPGGNLREPLRDQSFRRYLAGFAVITLGTVPMASFLPLFMQEQVGLSSGSVLWLQTGSMVGGLISGYLWGWASDRYGSKPVMVWGIVLKTLLPICWLLMPRHSPFSLPVALAIAVLQGSADMGWLIGSGRLLFVRVVPSEKKSDYMAVYYAWAGITGGISQLMGGRALDLFQGLSGQVAGLTLDPYVPLFLAGLIAPLVSLLLFQAVRADSLVGAWEFAGLFVRGNPFLAMGSMMRYHWARDEHTAVLITESLGRSKSLLTVEELLEALQDPRFHVRFEAITAVSRMKPDKRLLQALARVLAGPEPALAVIAAWALGRMGDVRAIRPLRAALHSHYRSIQAHSSRALAALADTPMIPVLLQRLTSEPDYGLRVAYGSALGQLRAVTAVPPLLALLDESEDPTTRLELALALGRIVGDEHHFIHLWRQMQGEMGTAVSQAITALQKKNGYPDITPLLQTCADTFARGQLAQGSQQLVALTASILQRRASHPNGPILQACMNHLSRQGIGRLEYLILLLHTLGAMGGEGD